MPHLSPWYRFLTVLYAVFFFGFAVSNIPQCLPHYGKSCRFRRQYHFFDHCCFGQYFHLYCFPQGMFPPSALETLVSMSRCHRSFRRRHCAADVCPLPTIVSRQAFGRLFYRRISGVYCNYDPLWSVTGYNDGNKLGPTFRLAVEDEVQTSCKSQACWSGRRLHLVQEHCSQHVGIWRQGYIPQFKLCVNITERADTNMLLPENLFHSSSAKDTGSCKRHLPVRSRAASLRST